MRTVDSPLIAHVIYRLDIGGMENGLINLINHMSPRPFRHAIVCIDDYSSFRQRLRRDDVEVIAIRKRPGKDLGAYRRLFDVFRRIQPTVVHTRNLAGLDGLGPALLARAPCRIHGEHGRDIDDVTGSSKKLRFLRWLHRPLVDLYTCVSKDLQRYLEQGIGVPRERIQQIYNGVDTSRFRPATNPKRTELRRRMGEDKVIVGTVGRCQAVKGQRSLVEAFIQLVRRSPEFRELLRLVIVGDGPERAALMSRLQEENLGDAAWLPGAREDIPAVLQSLDLFVLPSLSEGISNTILEAMATGLPIIATRVGGNSELVEDGVTGQLVTPGDTSALVNAIQSYVDAPDRRADHGGNARRNAEALFSIEAMVQGYSDAYELVMRQNGLEVALGSGGGSR